MFVNPVIGKYFEILNLSARPARSNGYYSARWKIITDHRQSARLRTALRLRRATVIIGNNQTTTKRPVVVRDKFVKYSERCTRVYFALLVITITT